MKDLPDWLWMIARLFGLCSAIVLKIAEFGRVDAIRRNETTGNPILGIEQERIGLTIEDSEREKERAIDEEGMLLET